MHSAVMQNKKYLKFASQNTVEVLALGGLDRAMQREKADSARIAQYEKVGQDGQKTKYMVQWPSLTYDQILALNRSPAGRFNQSGGIPHTAIVNPHSLEKMQEWTGGQSAKSIIDAAEEAMRALRKEHGKGMSRSLIRNVDMAIVKANAEAGEGEFAKALKSLDKASKKSDKWPESLQTKVSDAREAVIAAASTKLDEIESMEAVPQKRALSRMRSKLRGTGLEDRVKQMLDALKD